jgi:hypothetical protein
MLFDDLFYVLSFFLLIHLIIIIINVLSFKTLRTKKGFFFLLNSLKF